MSGGHHPGAALDQQLPVHEDRGARRRHRQVRGGPEGPIAARDSDESRLLFVHAQISRTDVLRGKHCGGLPSYLGISLSMRKSVASSQDQIQVGAQKKAPATRIDAARAYGDPAKLTLGRVYYNPTLTLLVSRRLLVLRTGIATCCQLSCYLVSRPPSSPLLPGRPARLVRARSAPAPEVPAWMCRSPRTPRASARRSPRTSRPKRRSSWRSSTCSSAPST